MSLINDLQAKQICVCIVVKPWMKHHNLCYWFHKQFKMERFSSMVEVGIVPVIFFNCFTWLRTRHSTVVKSVMHHRKFSLTHLTQLELCQMTSAVSNAIHFIGFYKIKSLIGLATWSHCKIWFMQMWTHINWMSLA